MKTLLRSTFSAASGDSKDALLQNFRLLDGSGLGFEQPEDISIWTFVRDFVLQHHHVPELNTIRSHFERTGELPVVDRLEVLATVRPRVRGDFQKHLEEKAEDRRVVLVGKILSEAGEIVSKGVEVKEGREKKLLRGPIDAMRFVLDRAHDIVTPAVGARLTGDVTKDGDDFLNRYDTVKNDPLSGIGQFTGLQQMDEGIRGAKRNELWIHAAFTGHLKCLAGDARIYDLTTGRLRTVREIHASGDRIQVNALDEKSMRVVTAEASPVYESGVRTVYQVETSTGRATRVTSNHPLLTQRGWVDAADICPGDYLAVPTRLHASGASSPYGDEEVAILGYLLGDGTITENDLQLSNIDDARKEDFARCLEAVGYKEAVGANRPRYASYRVSDTGIRFSKSTGQDVRFPWTSPVRDLLENLGLLGCRAGDKFIPGDLWRMSDAQVWIFLAALWATDGAINVVHRTRAGRRHIAQVNIHLTSKSRRLAEDVRLLLQRVGVAASVSKVHVQYEGERRPFWTVNVVTRSAKLRFLEQCHPVGKTDDVDAARNALAERTVRQTGDKIPSSFLSRLPENLRVRTAAGGWHYVRHAKQRQMVERDTLARFAFAANDTELVTLAGGDVRWEQVKSVREDGEEMTYDLSVPGLANFVADGFYSHNSTLMMNWAYNQAVYYGHDTLIFSLEMPYVQCRNLLYAMHSSNEKFSDVHPPLDYMKIRDGQLSEKEEWFLREHVVPDFNSGEYGSIHIEVADPDKVDFTVADMRARAETLYSKTPFSMIFVDHALLVAPRRWVPSTTDRLNEVIRDCKRLSMSFNKGMGIAMVLLFQISREGYRAALKARQNGTDHVYNLTFLSYANEAERSADIVTSSWLDEELGSNNQVLYQCLKSRDQKPFEPFKAAIYWPTRSLRTLLDPNIEDVEQAGTDIDSIADEIS